MEKQMRLKVMRHSDFLLFFLFFFFPRRNHYIMKVINSFRNKDTCHNGCKKERSKVTTAVVRFHFYYLAEQFVFFASFYVLSIFTAVFFFPSFTIFDLFAPPFKKPWMEKIVHNCIPNSKPEGIQKASVVGTNMLWPDFR